ncbi:oxysterol-binding protein-related protein 1-like isoform X1 [Conger conger]|uniref:oxysterol-binding protein-related protein 1-like isoform X1 n=1 Tax=Conger conger TaxID=82655 RepID=UPI002A59F322|nr:oxysterol-binding protein-related protein 1-like isoform X1 [Conger conger]XP_061110525.1 oxysterol-binding protein-related protein 1-like isoform X1 [Conger conger]
MDLCDPEEQFLQCARSGDISGILRLLLAKIKEGIVLNINCRGKNKANLGWTALHLASYFGHREVVEELLKAGADVNLANEEGDTALHKAALTERKEIVLLLLRYDSRPSAINGTGRIPRDCTRDDEIITMLDAAERREQRRAEEKLLSAAREGDALAVAQLLARKPSLDIHCKDVLGNTPLHCAVYRGQERCVLQLLRSGASPSIRNRNDKSVFDLANSTEMKKILEGNPEKGLGQTVQMFEGSLWKRSRFRGWRSHWVVLMEGSLSWYPKRSDSAADIHRQGCKNLTEAQCMVKAWDSCCFTLACFDGSVHHFKVSPRNDPGTTRKKWLEALEEHSTYSTQYCSQDPGRVEGEGQEQDVMSLSHLTDSLQIAEASQQKLETQVSTLLSMAKNSEAESLSAPILLKVKEVRELSGETCASLRSCLELLSQHEEVWSLKLEQEVEKNKILSEALQTLATEHHSLKQSLSRTRSLPQGTFPEYEFYDAYSDSDSEHSLSGFLSVTGHSLEEESVWHNGGNPGDPTAMSEGNHGNEKSQCNGTKKRRTCLPAPMFSRNDFSIWSILKKCIGMELSKIAMPVVFNEPLSFLQRLTEYMEHTYLIHQANSSSDSAERMKCVAAFAVSAVASQWERTGKPFNPLLGETYELVREDLGFRLMSEQVSHHPPVSAFQAEGLNKDFVFHGSIYPKLKFWGKSVEAEPKGIITLELPKHNEAYTWTNPICCVHNIIVGQLWIEQYGNVEVINHKTGERCCLTFKPCGLFGKELHKVEGYILDKSKKKLCALYGKWTECLYTVDPASFDAHKKTDRKNPEEKKSTKPAAPDEEAEDMPPPEAETVQVIPGSELLWRIAPRPENYAEMYAFSTFAMQLNELDEEMEGVIPKTDCRLRPDIRAMENGDIDLASEEKKRLEEKQRASRKNRSKSDEDWKTRNPAPCCRWFNQGPNPHNGSQDWLYTGGYWDRNYSTLPDIY